VDEQSAPLDQVLKIVEHEKVRLRIECAHEFIEGALAGDRDLPQSAKSKFVESLRIGGFRKAHEHSPKIALFRLCKMGGRF
jgi:hypothetical protein